MEIKHYMNYDELFFWFLISGLACLFLEVILGNTQADKNTLDLLSTVQPDETLWHPLKRKIQIF